MTGVGQVTYLFIGAYLVQSLSYIHYFSCIGSGLSSSKIDVCSLYKVYSGDIVLS